MEEYDYWNIRKKSLSHINKKPFFKEGEVWWCSIGLNLGSEVMGKGDMFRRPVVILKKLSAETCIVLPITSKEKEGSWFTSIDTTNGKRWVMLHQIRMIHVKRFQKRMLFLESGQFINIKEKIKQFY